MDLSKLSDSDLKAIERGDLRMMSASGLQLIAGEQPSSAGTMSRFATGVGVGLGQVGRGLKQALDVPAQALERTFGGERIGQALGMPTAAASAAQTAAGIEAAKATDAAATSTTAGKVGSVVGQALGAAPAMLIPGANTYVGAGLVGAGTGFLTTEGDVGERSKAGALGAAGGIVGKGIGEALGAGARALSNSRATNLAAQQAAAEPRLAAVQTARDAGYILPPTEMRAGALNSALEGLSGKIKTSQKASTVNQSTTNTLAKRALGMNADEALTPDALRAIRTEAGNAYNAVASTGTVTPSAAYDAALDSIVAPFKKASAGFPNAKPNPIIAEIESLRSPQFDAGAAVGKIRELRDAADAAYRAGSKEQGKAFKSAAGAIEDVLDGHLSTMGNPTALQAFRDARTTIAKTYTVEKALNPATGNVAAAKLAGDFKKGRPLSGDLETIGKVGSAFPKATQDLPQAYNAVSPLDWTAGLMSGVGSGGNPLAAAIPFVRPAVRAGLLSPAYQQLAQRSAQLEANPLAQGLLAVPQSRPFVPLSTLLGIGTATNAR